MVVKINNSANSVISSYYYSSNDEIKKMIYTDLSSGLSEDEIVNKIMNGSYDVKERSR